MKLSEDLNKIVNRSIEISKKLKCSYTGSEHILLALFESKDTICHFLLDEDKITMDDLLKAYFEVLSKESIKEIINTYSKTLTLSLKESEKIALKYNSKYVYDEHLFYCLLTVDSTLKRILIELKLDTNRYIEDVLDILNIEDEEENNYPFLINLSKTKSEKTYVPRGNYLERMITILNKKQKHNPLLIGNPGVGKTALVEGLSKIIDKDVYELSIGKTLSNTKYRGELEEKIVKTMDYIKDNNAVLFIDEIHNIVCSNNSDASIDIANILKPYLTKQDFLIIGATTLDEYHNYFSKDKALVRRFQNIYIDEPNTLETKKILKGVIQDFEKFHNIKYSNKIIDEVIKMTKIYLPNRTFPDKAIDVIDELGSKKEYPLLKSLKEIIKDITGIKTISINKLKTIKLNYPQVKKYYERLINVDTNIIKNNIVVIKTNNDFSINGIMDDLNKIFSIKKECLLEINMENYLESVMLNNLIGSSKGYVGYNEGGLLTEHIIKYPISIIYFKNLDKANYIIEQYIYNLFKVEKITDNKNRTINLSNCIFIYSANVEENSIGLVSKMNNKNTYYDVKIEKSS